MTEFIPMLKDFAAPSALLLIICKLVFDFAIKMKKKEACEVEPDYRVETAILRISEAMARQTAIMEVMQRENHEISRGMIRIEEKIDSAIN